MIKSDASRICNIARELFQLVFRVDSIYRNRDVLTARSGTRYVESPVRSIDSRICDGMNVARELRPDHQAGWRNHRRLAIVERKRDLCFAALNARYQRQHPL